MQQRSILFYLLVISITCQIISCTKYVDDKNVPQCLELKISDFSQSSNCDDANVKEYLFQNKTVYVFTQGTCGADFSSEVIGADCEYLGMLGGIGGLHTINGENFDQATYVDVIWAK